MKCACNQSGNIHHGRAVENTYRESEREREQKKHVKILYSDMYHQLTQDMTVLQLDDNHYHKLQPLCNSG